MRKRTIEQQKERKRKNRGGHGEQTVCEKCRGGGEEEEEEEEGEEEKPCPASPLSLSLPLPPSRSLNAQASHAPLGATASLYPVPLECKVSNVERLKKTPQSPPSHSFSTATPSTAPSAPPPYSPHTLPPSPLHHDASVSVPC